MSKLNCLVSGLSAEHFRQAIESEGEWGEELWPRYTASIDAALTLVPQGLAWRVGFDGEYIAQVRKKPFVYVENFGAATPAISLCIAALKARLAVSKVYPHECR